MMHFRFLSIKMIGIHKVLENCFKICIFYIKFKYLCILQFRMGTFLGLRFFIIKMRLFSWLFTKNIGLHPRFSTAYKTLIPLIYNTNFCQGTPILYYDI